MPRGKTIGILGGMGPHASARFLDLFHRELNRRDIYGDGDFPRVIYLSLPLSDFDVTGARDKRSVAKQVLSGADWLSAAGCGVIAIPCNSVHEFHREIAAAIPVPVLSIVAETRVMARGRIGVLCSRQSRAAALYDGLYASDQDGVDAAIDGVIKGHAPDIDMLLDDLRERGADTVILGCTELSLCRWRPSADVVDSSLALARALAHRL